MILVSYETTNWGPHKYQKVEFPSGAKTVALVAENDQGKSWVVRGIGFCLSIGRNEYGDQSAIHDGEAEATHKLVIEHAGERHTIKKVVRGKRAEEEGTQTTINGKPADRATYERFYAETLGLPHPSVWLPIVIAMQNETDFHLRRKKAEREEALRAACQLTRIDSWKDALQTRVNEEDKTLLAQEAGLKSRKEALEKDAGDLAKEKEELEATLASCLKPLGESGPLLETILPAVAAFESAVSAQKRADLENENRKRELALAKGTVERIALDLAKSPGASPEEESRTADWLETLQTETEAREKKELSEKLADRLKASTKKHKELAGLKDCATAETITSLETVLGEISRKVALAEEKEREAREALGELSTPADWEAEILSATKEGAEEAAKADALTKAGNAYTDAINEARRLCVAQVGIGDFPDLTKVAESLTALLNECAEFGEGPLGGAESKSVLQRLLSHWESHPHETCPICDRALEGIPTFQNAKTRKAVLASLHGEMETRAELGKTRRDATLAIRSIEIAAANETPLKENAGKEWQDWAELAAKRRTAARNAETKAKALGQGQRALDAAKASRTAISTLVREMQSLHPEAKTSEASTALLKTLREAASKKRILEVELASLEREAKHFEESCTRLSHAKDPSTEPEVTGLDADALKTALEKTRAKNRTLREARTARANLERGLATAKTKLEGAEATAKTALAEVTRLAKEISEGCGMPPAEPGDAPNERALRWRQIEAKTADTRARLAPLPEKLTAKQEEIQKTSAGLEETAKAAAKAAAARRLVAFLDYKNAPRKLLSNICERLFETTNRIAEVLQADIRLKIGKNLDFLTLQYRAGRLIEQKTERLGFGKGAVLGICFRLACQKLLLPDTGFLILDEPTANVDVKRKDALKTFLQNLGEETESKTKQIVLIEHDLNVIELCQAKIQVGEQTAPADRH